jgi:hypothetical protein
MKGENDHQVESSVKTNEPKTSLLCNNCHVLDQCITVR